MRLSYKTKNKAGFKVVGDPIKFVFGPKQLLNASQLILVYTNYRFINKM